MVDLRLNILDKYRLFCYFRVTKTHQGKQKEINFDINKFKNLSIKLNLL